MKWLTGYIKKRKAAKGFGNQTTRQTMQTFILEPILTPSGILDGYDDIPDTLTLDWETSNLPDIDSGNLNNSVEVDDASQGEINPSSTNIDTDSNHNGAEINTLKIDINNEDLEIIDFIENFDDTEVVANQNTTLETNNYDILELNNLEKSTDFGIESTVVKTNENAEKSLTIAETDSPEETVTSLSDLNTDEADNSSSQLVEVIEIDNNEESITPNLNNESSQVDVVSTESVANETTDDILSNISLSKTKFDYDSGVFVVGETGEVSIDFLFDGGGYQGELAIFSLDGMDGFEPDSQEFIKEAANRALSGSKLGHIVIADVTEGARFSGDLGEINQNEGAYLGVKTFVMRPGDKFAVMLVPNGTVAQVFNNPAVDGALRPLFSLVTSNPNDTFHVGQIADVTGEGNTFVMEDMRVDTGSDRDYNDIVFQVRGATGKAVLMDEVVASDKDWRSSELGQALINYAKPYITPEIIDDGGFVSENDGTNNEKHGLEVVDNNDIPVWVEYPKVNSDQWVQSLTEIVDQVKESNQSNTVVNLSFNLTNSDGTPRYELTTAERAALAYAQRHNVLIVASAGDNPGQISAIGQASLEFDNIITVGSAERVNDSVALSAAYNRAEYSGSGYALDIVAPGGTAEQPITVTSGNGVIKEFGTSIATAKVSGAASQVWAANPDLSYRQVIDILKRTATDLKIPNWDLETGAGLLNIAAAVHLAKVTPAIDVDVPVRYDFKKSDQPLIGIIDTGFISKNPDIDYRRIILGRDRVDNDNNPLLENGEGSEHGSHILGIIGATQSNGIGIDGMNDDAPIWLGRAIGSGKWAESLREFVDAAKASGQPNAVVNLSFELTQINSDGSVTTRYELTPQEREALEYARQNGVMVVVAAGNNGGTMSALGQASQEFDNVITVGSIDYNGNRADYSNFGFGLDFVARGGTPNQPVMSTVGEGADIGLLSGEEEPPEDEMSTIARNTFEEVFGPFSDSEELESDEQELENLTPEERQVYDEATKEIDQLLKDYLGNASQKIALEYVDGYYAASVDALSQFVDAFDENLADNLIKAEEILGNAGFDTSTSTTAASLNFSIPIDLGVGEMTGTSVAAAKVTGAVSQVWAANPRLGYLQIKEILQKTAVDLNSSGWDAATGSGLVNVEAAIELAKRTQPQPYQPKPIQSPLTWSGEGKVTPGERAVSISVPNFTGQVINAGYVTTVGFLKIRSGPGQNYPEVGRKYPGEAVNFDAYENNGSWVSDPYMPGGGSSRWYKIAGTNNWMSALYIDNTPELAEQERQRLEAIRRAEEEARRAEEEARRAEEEARRAEEELQRILEEQRRQQEQLQAAINQISQKVGNLGTQLGSYVSNGVRVYQFDKGILLIQPDGSSAFYEAGKKVAEFLGLNNEESFGYYLKDKFLDPIEWLDGGKEKIAQLGQHLAYKKLVSPGVNGFITFTPRFGEFSKYIDESFSFLNKTSDQWDNLLAFKAVNPGTNGFVLPRFGSTTWSKFAKGTGAFGAVIGLVPDAINYFSTSDPKEKREIAVEATFKTFGTIIGGGIGSVFGGPAGAFVGAFAGDYLGSLAGDWVNKNWDTTLKPLTKPLEDGFNAVSSFTNNALETAKAKAQGALEKAKAAAATAKAAYQAATTTVQQAKAVYQTFKQEIQKQTTQIVQQSQQKIKEEAQKVLNKVVQNPVIQQGSKVVKQVANYAQKAVKAVGGVINGAKQFVKNVINTGKQIINNVIEAGKKTYETVKNFVANTYETGKKVVTETYNKAAQAVNTVKNTISTGFNSVKSLFGFG